MSRPNPDQPSALVLCLVRAVGAVFLVGSCWWLFVMPPLAVLAALVGQRLLLRPGDLRSPWVDAVVELVRHWHGH